MLDKIINFINKNIAYLYWNTLRLNRINKDEWAGVKKNKWWNRGSSLVAVITTRCAYHCDYCPMFLTDPKYPRFNECSLNEWKEFFITYPEWLSQIYISGGEPTKISYLPDLINWLVERGHHVCLFTNLEHPENLYGVKNHWRFVAVPTFHKDWDTPQRFAGAYAKLKDRFRMICQEMEPNHQLLFTKHKDFFSEEWFKEENTLLHAMPDTPKTKKLYQGCNAGYKDGKINKGI